VRAFVCAALSLAPLQPKRFRSSKNPRNGMKLLLVERHDEPRLPWMGRARRLVNERPGITACHLSST